MGTIDVFDDELTGGTSSIAQAPLGGATGSSLREAGISLHRSGCEKEGTVTEEAVEGKAVEAIHGRSLIRLSTGIAKKQARRILRTLQTHLRPSFPKPTCHDKATCHLNHSQPATMPASIPQQDVRFPSPHLQPALKRVPAAVSSPEASWSHDSPCRERRDNKTPWDAKRTEGGLTASASKPPPRTILFAMSFGYYTPPLLAYAHSRRAPR